MDETQARLINCFSAVFPELSDEQIVSATSATVRAWDSVAVVTLIATIEEEFGVSLEHEDLSGLSSFQGFLSSIKSRELQSNDKDVIGEK